MSHPSSMTRLIHLTVLSLAIGLVIGCLMFIYPLPSVYHNYKMAVFMKSFLDSPVFADGAVLAHGQRFGHLWGNSNHCDAEVAVVFTAQLSVAELSRLITTDTTYQDIIFPFNQPSPYALDTFLVKDDTVQLIAHQLTFPLIFDEDYNLYGIDDKWSEAQLSDLSDFQLEKDDYLFLQALVQQANLSDPQTNVYLIRATDQAYSGYSQADWRCS